MITLIVYDSKYGFTEMCAKYLHEKIPESVIKKTSDNFDVMEYDKILIGTYIYVGEITSNTHDLLVKYKNELLKKKLGIFCAGLNKEEFSDVLQNGLDPDIFYNAKIIHPGGKVKLESLTFFERRKIKKRLNIIENIDLFYPNNLDELLVF